MDYKDIVLWWQNKAITTSEDLEVALDNFKVLSATNSNSIEGNTISYHTTREIFEGGTISNFTGSAREIFEAQNQKYAFDFLSKSFETKRPITIDFILELHKILLYGCYDDRRWKKGERPGKFKVNDYCVGTTEVGSEPEYVLENLEALLAEINELKDKGDVLIKAAYFHAQFETIHPFADGNGRTGRALLNYYLLLNNYPPIVIYSEDSETYYLALEVYNHADDIKNFAKFLQEQLLKTWRNKVSPSNEKKLIEHLNSF